MIHIRRSPSDNAGEHPTVDIPLSINLKDNVRYLSSLYQESSDVVFRRFMVGKQEALLIYIEGLTDTQRLNELVLDTLLNKKDMDWTSGQQNVQSNLHAIKNSLPLSNLSEAATFSACTEAIASGSSILMLD